MDEYDRDGAHAEIERLAALHQSKRPVYSDRMLSHQTPGTEHFGAPPDAELTAEDLIGAQRELAEKHGISSARVRGMVMLTTAQAGLGYSPGEQAQVIGEVMLALDAGKMNVSEAQIAKLSGRADGGTIGLAAAIPDAAHLQAAAVLARSGHGGYSAAAVAKRARELGVPSPLDSALRASPDTMQLALSMAGAAGDEDVPEPADPTQESAALALAAPSGGRASAAAVVGRHPELAHLFKKGKTSSRKHPVNKKVTSKSRAHVRDLDDDDPRDHRQPARGGAVHADVRRLIEQNPDLFTDGTGHEGGKGRQSYGPGPYRPPGSSGKPQSPAQRDRLRAKIRARPD